MNKSNLTKIHVGPYYAVPQHQKDVESERIAADLREFESRGGVIQKLEHGARSEWPGKTKRGEAAKKAAKKALVINAEKAGDVWCPTQPRTPPRGSC